MSQRKINEMFISSGKSPGSSQPDLPSRTERAKSKSKDVAVSNDDPGDNRPVAKNPTPHRKRRVSWAPAKSPGRDQDYPSATLIPSTPPSAPLSSQKKTPNSTGRANERVPETPQQAQPREATRATSQKTPARRTPSKQTPNRVTPKKTTPSKTTPKKPAAQKQTPEKPTPKKSTPKKPTPKKSTPKKLTPKKSTTPVVGSSPFTAIDISSGAESSDCELVKVESTPSKKRKQNITPGSENTNTKRQNTREVASESPIRPAVKPKSAIKEKQAVARNDPAAQKPGAQKTSQKPGAQKPAQRSATEEPAIEEPIVRKPSAQKTASQKPTVEKQNTQQSTAQKSAAKKPRAKSLPPRAKTPHVPSRSAPATLSVAASQSARPAIKAKFLKGSQLELARSGPAENKADDSDCFIEKVEPSPKRRAQSQPATTPAKKKRVSKVKAAVAVSDKGPVEKKPADKKPVKKKSVKKKPVETDSDCEIVKVTRSPKKRALAAKPALASAHTMTCNESDADADAENSEEDRPPRKKARPALRKKLPPRSPKTPSRRTPAKTKPVKAPLQNIAIASPVIDLTEDCDSEDSEISSDDVSGSNSENSPAVVA
ncbi:hypothetical protein QQX98_011814 [Neonectria punicea]|uniref:Proteoglycan 4-like n=1 Tax=Neonectria punicea TaxID=979145 RepID=A0ABR1GKZ3_9HYPO